MGTLGLNKDKRYKQGYYYPKNKDKYVRKGTVCNLQVQSGTKLF